MIVSFKSIKHVIDKLKLRRLIKIILTFSSYFFITLKFIEIEKNPNENVMNFKTPIKYDYKDITILWSSKFKFWEEKEKKIVTITLENKKKLKKKKKRNHYQLASLTMSGEVKLIISTCTCIMGREGKRGILGPSRISHPNKRIFFFFPPLSR